MLSMKMLHSTRRLSIKLIHIVLLMLLVYLLAFSLAQAQNQSEEIRIPLSKPGQAGELKVQLLNGSIIVRGYEGNEVIIRPSSDDDEDHEEEEEETEKGLRKIGSSSFGLEAVEENNRVHVEPTFPNGTMLLEIQVPTNFSVKAQTVNNGRIRIENVRGEIEATNVNGDISLEKISGSAVANTVNGELTATFEEVTPDTPMSFTSLNGDIDVTFPASTKMLAKMKSANGEIYTDFDMELNQTNNRETSNKGGVYRVRLDNQVSGKVNGGGPEMYFENHNGDIVIRKR